MGVESQILKIKNELPSTVKLVAVSKFHPAEMIVSAYRAGQRSFAENRPQELKAKYDALSASFPEIEWHFIGHLQSNKVKIVVPCASMIQSVDSLELLRQINLYSEKCNKTMDCLLQVHIASELSKQGFLPDEILSIAQSVAKDNNLTNINIRGLMGMASFVPDVKLVEKEFSSLQEIFNEIKKSNLFPQFDTLSMGMSNDYHSAIKFGATIVRIGTDIFGSR